MPAPSGGGRQSEMEDNSSLRAHLGADFFPWEGGECLKRWSTPQKGSRGEGILFAHLGEGVEGGEGEIFKGEKLEFLQKQEKEKAISSNKIRAYKTTKIIKK